MDSGGGDSFSPPFLIEANFLIRPNPVRKGRVRSGIKSHNTGLGGLGSTSSEALSQLDNRFTKEVQMSQLKSLFRAGAIFLAWG